MKGLKLPALKKNVLKYRALEMILILHEFESFKRFVVESLRTSDRVLGTGYLPFTCKKPFPAALQALVTLGIIDSRESESIRELASFRNRIGHEIHTLVADVSHANLQDICLYSYEALSQLERLRAKVFAGMARKSILCLSLDQVMFQQAELTYKQELIRLSRRIRKQAAAG